MVRKFILVLLLLLLAILGFSTDYYVKTGGNDSYAGTSDGLAWATLSKVNSTALNAGDRVYFRRGDTFTGALNITRSGTGGNPITFSSYGTGANAIINALATVTGWTNIGGNIWESNNAVTTESTLNMVLINDVNVPMGRYPNTGYLTINAHSGQTSITCSTLSGTPSFVGGEAVVRIFDYYLNRRTISAHSGGTLTVSSLIYEPENGYGFFIQAHPNTLDTQNEWYFNPSTRKLRIYSTTQPTNVKVTTGTNLITIGGSFLTFDNLTIQGANNSGFYNYSTNTQYLTIQNCLIWYIGNEGVHMWNEHFTMTNTTIQDCNNMGLNLPSQNSNATIRNNTIIRAGVLPGMGFDNMYCAMNIENNDNMIVEYNHINGCGYKGIGWWGSLNCLVKNNYVEETNKVLEDGAGIYCSAAEGGRITGNIVVRCGSSGAGTKDGLPGGDGIYLDDYSTGIEMDNNFVAQIQGHGIFMHNNTYCNIHNNIMYDCGKAFAISENLTNNNNTVTYNQYIAKTATQRTANYFTAYNHLSVLATMDYNVYARPLDDNATFAWYEPAIGGSGTIGTLAQWQAYTGQDAHSTKSPLALTSESQFLMQINPTATPVGVSLSGQYMDMRGLVYTGTISVPAYSGVVLMQSSVADATAPVIQSFSIPSSSRSLTIDFTDLRATDNVGVTGYLVNESSTKPSATATGWNASFSQYTFTSTGSKTLYAWAKDAAGNVSNSLSATTTILPASTSDYYVDDYGSNTNSGLDRNNPWQTIQYALSRVTAPGNTIHIMGGTYTLTSSIDIPVGVSLVGDGIDVTNIVCHNNSITSRSLGLINLNSSPTTPTRVVGNQSISYMTISGDNMYSNRGIHIGYRSNVSVHHVKIKDFNWTGITFRGLENYNEEPNIYIPGNSFTYSYIDNCGTRNFPPEAEQTSCSLAIRGQESFEVSNCEFTQVARASGYNGNILGGEFNRNLKIHDNKFTKNENEDSSWNFYIELWHFMGGGEIYNNEFIGGATTDIVDVEVSPGTTYGLQIYNNTFRCTTNPPYTARQIQAIDIELKDWMKYVYIYGNTMINYPNGIWLDIHCPNNETIVENGVVRPHTNVVADHIYIYRNKMDNIGMNNMDGQAIFVNAYDSWNGVKVDNIYICNNSISNLYGIYSAQYAYPCIDLNVIDAWTNIYIQNNIIYKSNGYPVNIDEDTGNTGTIDNLRITNNFFYQNRWDTINNAMASGTVTNYTRVNNHHSNPGWTRYSPLPMDMNLVSGANAIDEGVIVSNVIGNDADGTAPDCGAIPRSSGAVPTDTQAPAITSFTIPVAITNLTIPIISLSATDNVGVSAYLLTETPSTPSLSNPNWKATWSNYTFSDIGTRILYAWARDVAGNISPYEARNIVISNPSVAGKKPIQLNNKPLIRNNRILVH